ncbi:unnamed protein product, partial [Rotaria magnacalcarata]
DNSKATTTKKGPTKRSAPTSGKKVGAVPAKKKLLSDEPFEDHTNEEKIEEADNNTEDEASTVKQAKKGRPATKAAASTSKTNNRSAKKTKAT